MRVFSVLHGYFHSLPGAPAEPFWPFSPCKPSSPGSPGRPKEEWQEWRGTTAIKSYVFFADVFWTKAGHFLSLIAIGNWRDHISPQCSHHAKERVKRLKISTHNSFTSKQPENVHFYPISILQLAAWNSCKVELLYIFFPSVSAI